jgi:hypothetical protein
MVMAGTMGEELMVIMVVLCYTPVLDFMVDMDTHLPDFILRYPYQLSMDRPITAIPYIITDPFMLTHITTGIIAADSKTYKINAKGSIERLGLFLFVR